MGLLGGAQWASARHAAADHHVVSAGPLQVVSDLSSLEGRYTIMTDFYVRNHFSVPAIPAENSLRVEGEVEKPLRLTSEDLSRIEKRRLGAVLECAGNR